MTQKFITKALGLHTFKNELTVSDGAMQVADNVVIDKDGIVESRRGFNFYSDFGILTDTAKQLLQYKDKLLVHYDDKLLYEDANGAFQEFSGIYSELETGLRIKGLENKGNFYFTTDAGIKKISASSSSQFTTNSGYIYDAGAVRALDFELKCSYETTGFFDADSVVAYRIVWGYKDKNNNLLLGYPSEIGIVRNVDVGESCTVDITITIPSEIIDSNNAQNYFYQVYRSNLKTPYTTDADVEFKLVIEDFPTTDEIAGGFVNTNDLTPTDFRNSGADLYTNEVSGEGEQQANSRPPLATDIAYFKGSVFYSNTKSKHNKTLSLISVDQMTSGTTKFYISNEDGINEYIFRGVKQVSEIDGSGFPNNAAGIDTLHQKYFLLSAANNIREYFIWYYRDNTNPIEDEVPSTTETLGRIPVAVDITGATTTADVGIATYTALNALVDFDVAPDPGDDTILVITNTENGPANEISDATEPGYEIDGSVGFTTPTAGLGEDTDAGYILLSADPSAGVKLETTAKSMVKVVNANSSEVVNAFYLSSVNDVPGQISFQSKTAEDKPFYLAIRNTLLDNLDIDTITWVSGTTVSIVFNGTPDLTSVVAGNLVDIYSATNSSNNGTFEILSVDSGTYTIEIDNPNRTDATDDEVSDSPAICDVVNDIGSDFNPTLPVTHVSIPVSQSGDVLTVNWNSHGLSEGDLVYLFNATTITGVTDGIYGINYVDNNTFNVTISGIGGTSGQVDAFPASEVSDNEVKPNRVYFSKNDIPEAVPPFNYFDVGAQDSAIERIIPLRDSLFILKDEGVYRLSGTDAANFNVVLFDESSPIIAPDSPAVLNNQIFMISTQGIVTVSDTGVDIMSRNIERDILYPTSNNFPDFSSQCFGFASESDRAYYIFLPENIGDTVATQCFRFNVFTRAWTRWDLAKTCGIVKKADDKIYFGASDINYIEQERKSFLRTDYADRQYDNAIISIASGNIVELSSISNVEIYDAIYQEQYITIARFNRLLSALDNDPFLDDTDYLSTLEADTGADMGASLAALITKVDADDDLGPSYTTYAGSSDKTDLMNGFNGFIDELNASVGLFYSNYVQYDTLVKYEVIISAVDSYQVKATGITEIPFIVGDVILYKAIDCFVEYAPETLGDPSLGKHFREATLMFDQFNFTFGVFGFRSDVYASIAEVTFRGEGNGDYGTQVYGEKVYGGLANERPFRTYVPRNHQRCRHLIPSFRHQSARENFELNGYSVTYNEATTPRYYKR